MTPEQLSDGYEYLDFLNKKIEQAPSFVLLHQRELIYRALNHWEMVNTFFMEMR